MLLDRAPVGIVESAPQGFRYAVAVRLALVSHGAKSVLAFRSEVFVGVLSLCLRVLLVFLVWKAVYGARDGVAGISHDTAIGYAVLGAIFNAVLQPWQFSGLRSRVRTGNVVFDIMRPVSLITQSLAEQLGSTLAGFPKAIIAIAFGLVLGAVPGTASGLRVFAFIVSALAGIAIALLCNLIVGMVAFWTTDIGGALMVYSMAAAFCSGSLIPLWFMPAGLSASLQFLPFSAQVFTPLSIYFDHGAGSVAIGKIALQFAWIAFLTLLARLVWSRAFRRAVINGG